MNEQPSKKTEFFNGLILNSYNQIIENSKQLDSKTHSIITVATAILPLVLGLFYYLLNSTVTRSILFPEIALSIGFGVVMFILAMVKGCLTYKTFSYKALDSYTFLKRHFQESIEEVVEVAAVTLGDMTDQNWTLVQRKAASFEDTLRYLTLGAIAFGIGFLLLMSALMLDYFGLCK